MTSTIQRYTGSCDPTTTFVDNVIAAVNAFCNTLVLCGPYDDISNLNPSCVTQRLETTLCGLEIHEENEECLYMTDSLSLKMLETALQNVPVLKTGFAWPHLQYSSNSASVFWLMKEDTAWSSTCYATLTPCPKVWFVLPSSFEKLFEFDLEKLHLSSKKIICKQQLRISDDCTTSVKEITVTMVINNPGDLIVTLLSAEQDSSELKQQMRDSTLGAINQSKGTIIVAELMQGTKGNCYSKVLQHSVVNSGINTKHHSIIGKVPLWLEDILKIANTPSSLDSNIQDCNCEITVKNELFDDSSTNTPNTDCGTIMKKEDTLIPSVNYAEGAIIGTELICEGGDYKNFVEN